MNEPAPEFEIPPGKILPLVIEDKAALSKPCEEFNFSNPPMDPIQLSSDLVATMIASNGIGLAANQVGHPWRVFAMRTAPKMTVCFNPKIVMPSSEEIILEEGCLSFPDYVVKIKRPRSIRVRFTYPNGETVTEMYTGMTARVFQHELDHLNGVLFQSRANSYHREMAAKNQKLSQRHAKRAVIKAPALGKTEAIMQKAKEIGLTQIMPEEVA